MSKRETLARQRLIINKLRKKPATFDEISEYLTFESELQSYDFNISKRTFLRDKDDILALYKIEILYNTSDKVYYIDAAEQPAMNERMMEAYDVFSALNLSDKLSKHIHFEKRKSQGTEHLFGLLHAIKNNLQINFNYLKYWEETTEGTERTVLPYALKEFKYRWYLLAKDTNGDTIKTFAIDRMSDLEIMKSKFSFPIDFDVDTYFKYSFGIIVPSDQKPQEVLLSFEPLQGKYIKSLPLHSSQEIIIDNEDELQIKLTLYLTHDFFMELLSFGDQVEVLKPKNLIKEMKQTFNSILSNYN